MFYWDDPVSVFFSPTVPELTLTFLRGPRGADRLFFLESASPASCPGIWFESDLGCVTFHLDTPSPKEPGFRSWLKVSEAAFSETLLGPHWSDAWPLLFRLHNTEPPVPKWDPVVFTKARELELWHLIDVFSLGATLPGPRIDCSPRRRRTSFAPAE